MGRPPIERDCRLLARRGQGIAYVACARPYRGGLAKSVGQSLAEWPAERGEALKATGLQAACRLSIFLFVRDSPFLSSGGPASLLLRASSEHILIVRDPRARKGARAATVEDPLAMTPCKAVTF